MRILLRLVALSALSMAEPPLPSPVPVGEAQAVPCYAGTGGATSRERRVIVEPNGSIATAHIYARPPRQVVLTRSATSTTSLASEDGAIVVRKMMNLSISLDHRVVDGADGARFMNEVIRFLQEPKLLLLGTR